MKLLAIENLGFTYPAYLNAASGGNSDSCAAPTLSEINLSVEAGEFMAVVGKTGCGKTTLVRLLKSELAPKGKRTGRIAFQGRDIYEMDVRDAASKIGFVCQMPEQQVVTDRVWHELAFGLESLGIPGNEIRRRVCEIADFFGIAEWFDQNTSKLSGGEQQILALASVMVMKPELLILDEPLSRLDPVSVKQFMSMLKRINEELGTTIILVEHNIEEAFSACNRVLLMEKGRVKYLGSPEGLTEEKNFRTAGMELFSKLGGEGSAPVSVRQARMWLAQRVSECGMDSIRAESAVRTVNAVIPESAVKADVNLPKDKNCSVNDRKEIVISCSDVYFRYEKSPSFAVNCLNLNVYAGEVFCILGGNGSGKSSLLSLLIAQNKASEGKIRIFGKSLKEYRNNSLYTEFLSWLPQNPQLLFAEDSVKKELENDLTPVYDIDLSALSGRHPFDISGGEQQLLAFMKIARKERRLLLLDEPTKGLDGEHKRLLAQAVLKLKAEGRTVLVVTHDSEFASMCADRCAFMFKGEAVSVAETSEFFRQNLFYTTANNRITSGII